MTDLLQNVRKIAAQRDACWSALVSIAAALAQPDGDVLAEVKRLASDGMERSRAVSGESNG